MKKQYVDAKLDAIDAIKLYKSGIPVYKIAAMIHCKNAKVSAYLRSHGVYIQPSGNRAKRHPSGTKVGNWVVIEGDTKPAKGHGIQHYCQCAICGHKMYVNINRKSTLRSVRCMKCKNSKILLDDGSVNVPYIIKYYFHNLTKNLIRRNKVSQLDFNITPEYLIELYHRQLGRCAISGMRLVNHEIKLADLVLSLDRIDSNQGYIKGNVQWVHKDINMMKQSFSNDRFIGICCMVAMHRCFEENEATQINPLKCPKCGEPIQMVEGCMTCPSCGYSKCS